MSAGPMPERARALLRGVVVALLTALTAVGTRHKPPPGAGDANAARATNHARPPDQTFLTFPEWFLVYSPDEYARFIADRPPSEFPYLGHLRQLWGSYGAVYDAVRDEHPLNPGYHAMILVIGTSTSVEYGIKATYENVVGRFTEATRRHGMTEEDVYAARVAREYVDFIEEVPWYEFEFRARVRGLWSGTSLVGPDLLRKWERKFALTTEYGVKALYGKLIRALTRASYETPSPVTRVWLDRLPPEAEGELPRLAVLERHRDGSTLVELPRYAPFTHHSLASRGKASASSRSPGTGGRSS